MFFTVRFALLFPLVSPVYLRRVPSHPSHTQPRSDPSHDRVTADPVNTAFDLLHVLLTLMIVTRSAHRAQQEYSKGHRVFRTVQRAVHNHSSNRNDTSQVFCPLHYRSSSIMYCTVGSQQLGYRYLLRGPRHNSGLCCFHLPQCARCVSYAPRLPDHEIGQPKIDSSSKTTNVQGKNKYLKTRTFMRPILDHGEKVAASRPWCILSKSATDNRRGQVDKQFGSRNWREGRMTR